MTDSTGNGTTWFVKAPGPNPAKFRFRFIFCGVSTSYYVAGSKSAVHYGLVIGIIVFWITVFVSLVTGFINAFES